MSHRLFIDILESYFHFLRGQCNKIKKIVFSINRELNLPSIDMHKRGFAALEFEKSRMF